MGSYCHHSFQLNISPPPPQGVKVGIGVSPAELLSFGFNLPVELSTATCDRKKATPDPLLSLLVMAHFDTGASITSIDIGLAMHLKLTAKGYSNSLTASGIQRMPNFVIDAAFPNTSLSPFANLKIGSCKLNFDLPKALSDPNDPKNFGILLGRDIMSRWNIVWNGPTSSVFIND
ncbi:MAG: retropepsin-like domain-containing protein [Treponema sp.]|jgi:hypothetical protein|nr:retropepsin-like domain-containing protein [Treponema sp.]